MSTDLLTSHAERQAIPAEELRAFSGLKLTHLKRQITELLTHIGHNGFFANYTKHDVSHLDAMLANVEWLIPAKTQKIMTPSDWLLIVLSIYFHDLGMFVTNDEYKKRDSSNFPAFKNSIFQGDQGIDYQDRLKALNPDDREKFLYEEFVRENHPARIKAWLDGSPYQHLGNAAATATEVRKLVELADTTFRRDLALVCESHHYDKIDDFNLFPTSRPYGPTKAEAANVHYAAIILRTADLLHITQDRTPSIMFRTLNPSDPISQIEWAKQMAVKSVRPQIGRNRDNKPDENALQDTIEIHALFKKEDGFFGLDSYLRYVAGQLKLSHDWVEEATKKTASKYEFPWIHLDDSKVETDGFLKQAFGFTIDQAKILNLLTGHTLYNDTSVVLREVIQNSLDAVRLRQLQYSKTATPYTGTVQVLWKPKDRILTVRDNGTGMTQQEIENHLLKVGASKYEEKSFKENFPDFSAISRFGIGILSAFMVSDDVEITTFNPDERDGRQLALKSVHGRYLVRLLDKHASRPETIIIPHGTSVSLRIRTSAGDLDVEDIMRRWIAIPGCPVELFIDDQPPVKIGFATPRDALSDALKRSGIQEAQDISKPAHKQIRVEQSTHEGVTLAYALTWSDYFQEWSFHAAIPPMNQKGQPLYIGTSVQGVRVEFNSPGYSTRSIPAVANITGTTAPKTNVARSGIEASDERTRMLRSVYFIYCDHIRRQIDELTRNFSLTWAIREAEYLLAPLIQHPAPVAEPTYSQLLDQAISEIPMVLIEDGATRRAVTAQSLIPNDHLWTADSAFFRSAEYLLREAAQNSSLSQLTTAMGFTSIKMPEGITLAGSPGPIRDIALRNREVTLIRIDRPSRRLDLQWAITSKPPRWMNGTDVAERPRPLLHNQARVFIQTGPVQVTDRQGEIGVKMGSTIFLFSDAPISKILVSWIEKARPDPGGPESRIASLIAHYCFAVLSNMAPPTPENANQFFLQNGLQPDQIDLQHLAESLKPPTNFLFDVSAWSRNPNFW